MADAMSAPANSVPLFQFERGGDRHVRRDVARITLERGLQRVPDFAKAGGETLGVAVATVNIEVAELALEHGRGAGKAVACERGRQHAGLGRAPEMQPFDHAAARLRKFEQPRTQRTGDAQRVRHARGIEPQQPPRHHRAGERPRQARRVETDFFAAVARCVADTVEHLGAGDERGDEFPAARADLLRHCEPRRRERGARMRADAGLHQAVHLERVGERAVGERRMRRRDFMRGAENYARAARGRARRVSDQRLVRRQRAAKGAHCDGVSHAIPGALDHRGRNVIELQRRCEFRVCLCHCRHFASPRSFNIARTSSYWSFQ